MSVVEVRGDLESERAYARTEQRGLVLRRPLLVKAD
jgi:hypothetical protein